MKKPVIGISDSELTKNVGPFVGYRRSYVNKDYREAFIKHGGVPLIIPFNEDADVTESQLELVNALILSGGQDIDSESYGEEPQPEQGTVWQARDQFDMRLLKLASKSCTTNCLPMKRTAKRSSLIIMMKIRSTMSTLAMKPKRTRALRPLPKPLIT